MSVCRPTTTSATPTLCAPTLKVPTFVDVEEVIKEMDKRVKVRQKSQMTYLSNDVMSFLYSGFRLTSLLKLRLV